MHSLKKKLLSVFSLYLSHSLCPESSPPLFSHHCSLCFPLAHSSFFPFTGLLQYQPPAPSSRHLQGLHQRQRLSMHLSLSISLPFSSLLRMTDYRSLHGLSGADRRLSWRERDTEREEKRILSVPPKVYPCALATLTM